MVQRMHNIRIIEIQEVDVAERLEHHAATVAPHPTQHLHRHRLETRGIMLDTERLYDLMLSRYMEGDLIALSTLEVEAPKLT